jgi:hypothetical protein
VPKGPETTKNSGIQSNNWAEQNCVTDLCVATLKINPKHSIQKFKSIQAHPNTPPPQFQYFVRLLEKKVTGADGVQHPGKLNPMESVKFARLALSHGKGELLQTWLSRLEASEELGDILIQFQTPDMCVRQRPWARKIADRLPAVTTA